mmetsp:Transcript_21911/g.74472  ORF Transcript_21911/g.74472 Transcript_21911/m.74472 type:complete len:284 (+) Transcript_21911:1186-2037(+)
MPLMFSFSSGIGSCAVSFTVMESSAALLRLSKYSLPPCFFTTTSQLYTERALHISAATTASVANTVASGFCSARRFSTGSSDAVVLTMTASRTLGRASAVLGVSWSSALFHLPSSPVDTSVSACGSSFWEPCTSLVRLESWICSRTDHSGRMSTLLLYSTRLSQLRLFQYPHWLCFFCCWRSRRSFSRSAPAPCSRCVVVCSRRWKRLGWKRLAPNFGRDIGRLSTRWNSLSSSVAKKLNTVFTPEVLLWYVRPPNLPYPPWDQSDARPSLSPLPNGAYGTSA